MLTTSGRKGSCVTPLSLRDAPALIQEVWPAQKISVETKREFEAHGAQTLTALGSFWKGRKRLVYVRACVLGALLPATGDAEKDLAVFEKLMAIDDEAFLHRENKMKPAEIAKRAIDAGKLSVADLPRSFQVKGKPNANVADFEAALTAGKLAWAVDAHISKLRLAAYSTLTYEDKVGRSLRPEELGPEAFAAIWPQVNEHLGTSASSIEDLVEQLGVMRFGHRPKVADIFSGAGSIPFEAARIGCDVYASDLNPIACMLTWGALHLIGGSRSKRELLEAAQRQISNAVDRRITHLGFEHNESGARAKAYLYCLESRCPATGWVVPLLPSLLISKIRRTIARLTPNRTAKRFELEIVSDVTDAEMEQAKLGTVRGGNLHCEIDGEVYRTPISSIRGDQRGGNNNLRRWEKQDVAPREGDILGERLYCVQWMALSNSRSRPGTYFAAPTDEDLKRDQAVRLFVEENLSRWQRDGDVPDMVIEPGEKTDEPIRTRGWTHWHHLYNPRQLMIAGLVAEQIRLVDDPEIKGFLSFDRTFLADKSSRLSHWRLGSPGREGRAASADGVENTFYNQALNTLFTYGARAFYGLRLGDSVEYKSYPIAYSSTIKTSEAENNLIEADLFITDPPYADAVNYHEISEFFIAWLRKNPPAPFSDWVWDSRRSLAVKGVGDQFRAAMVRAYSNMTRCMPDNGMQILMFTHTSAQVWADMAQIFWGAGLQVVAAWYVATETTADFKKGGYVQGTVTIVLRKRLDAESGYKDEIVQEVRAEVADQIDTMTGLNQSLKGQGRIENLFEDADLQMAGYAAALRVLTRYQRIDGTDMTKEALRQRRPGEKDLVGEVIEFAVQVANEHMVPDNMPAKVWERLSGPERFYLKMMDIETTSLRKLDNYQNFAKAFRVGDYASLMGSLEPNKASLKTAKQFRKAGFEIPDFGPSATRALLYAIFELENDVEGDEVLAHLRDQVASYHSKRDELVSLADYVARKRAGVDDAESRAARILFDLIRNERFG